MIIIFRLEIFNYTDYIKHGSIRRYGHRFPLDLPIVGDRGVIVQTESSRANPRTHHPIAHKTKRPLAAAYPNRG